MKNNLVKEIEELIEKNNLNCSVDDFSNKVYWSFISIYQTLSEPFIREFKDKVVKG